MSRSRPESFRHGRIEYGSTHTAGFVRQCITRHNPAGLTILCLFSHHCFTIEGAPGASTYTVEGEHRDFCPNRHADSLRLPALIKAHIDDCQRMRVYRTKDKNGASKLMIFDDPELDEAYFVYFDLKRSNNKYADIKMTVASAFRKRSYKPREYAKLGTELDRVMGALPKPKRKKRPKK